MTLDIRIVPQPGERGRRAIMVAGEQWGTAHMESLGPHGSSYYFQDMGGNVLGAEHASPAGKLPPKFRAFNIVGDKIAKRKAADYRTVAPLEDRMMAAVREWIERGILRSPAAVRAKADADNLAREKFRAQAATEAAVELDAKATEVLRGLTGYVMTGLGEAKAPHAEDVAAIVALIRWGQTK